MKDGTVRKVNFCFSSERIRMEDCSLEKDTEFFRIGEAEIEKARLGDPVRTTDIKTRKLLQDVFHQVVILESLHIQHQEDSNSQGKIFCVSESLRCRLCEGKMSIYNLAMMSNDILKKLAKECVLLNDV